MRSGARRGAASRTAEPGARSVTSTVQPASTSRGGRRLSAALFRRPTLRLVGLLALPTTWLVLVYLSALLALLATAFFSVDEFTNDVVRTFTLQNIEDVLSDPAYRQ